ncbi:MAG TPA: sialate O-acetylesterase [Flavisolibacter sp.]
MKQLTSLAVALILVTSVKANITLPSIIGSNMVLQQKSSVKFWGWGNPGERVVVATSWSSGVDSTIVTANADWQLSLNTPSAGGPHTITIRGYNKIVLENVLIGEVWVCSGQSNMEYNYNWGVPQMGAELAGASNLNLRFFHIPRTTARTPQDQVNAAWVACDSNSLKSFSAVGYFFGKKLNSELNVPIGLINASWGGTPAEVWTPSEEIEKSEVLKKAALQLKPSEGWPITPGYTFNGMIAPVVRFDIAGAIWYQGESNTETASTYHPLFSTMITSWRKAWEKDFPFYFVQLAPFRYGNKNIGALLREAQGQTLSVPRTGMVVTTDLAEDTLDIHPKNKRDVGLRLAAIALNDTYGRPSALRSPFFKSWTTNKGRVILTFNNPGTGLVVKGKGLQGLYVAGVDGRFYAAEGKVEKGQVIAWSKKVPEPAAVRYAFSNTAVGNLFSTEGLPLSPFRTDTWAVDTSAEQ